MSKRFKSLELKEKFKKQLIDKFKDDDINSQLLGLDPVLPGLLPK